MVADWYHAVCPMLGVGEGEGPPEPLVPVHGPGRGRERSEGVMLRVGGTAVAAAVGAAVLLVMG